MSLPSKVNSQKPSYTELLTPSAILPHAAAATYVDAVRGYLRQKPLPITLASAKTFAGERELLRYTGNGISLALNMPAGSEADRFRAALRAFDPKRLFRSELSERLGL